MKYLLKMHSIEEQKQHCEPRTSTTKWTTKITRTTTATRNVNASMVTIDDIDNSKSEKNSTSNET